MTERRRLSADERRRQIIHEATPLFRARSFEEVSLDDIASAAGVTRPLITHHFGSKRALYVEVVRRVLDVGTIQVPEYVHGTTLHERLESCVEKWVDNNDRNREVWLDAFRLQGLGGTEIGEVVEEAREHVALQAAAVIGLGPAEDLDPKHIAALRVWGGIAEAATLQWLANGRLTRDETRDLMLESLEYFAERLLRESQPKALKER